MHSEQQLPQLHPPGLRRLRRPQLHQPRPGPSGTAASDDFLQEPAVPRAQLFGRGGPAEVRGVRTAACSGLHHHRRERHAGNQQGKQGEPGA